VADCYVADGYWDIGYTESDICAIVPAGSPGGGGTVAKAQDPIRPDRWAQVRDTLADELDKAQRVDEPVIEAPRPRKKPVRTAPPALTPTPTLGIIRDIEARVQAAIEADAMAQALAQAEALALEMAFWAEDEAEIEMLLLAI
jgi:hypothetical protein